MRKSYLRERAINNVLVSLGSRRIQGFINADLGTVDVTGRARVIVVKMYVFGLKMASCRRKQFFVKTRYESPRSSRRSLSLERQIQGRNRPVLINMVGVARPCSVSNGC